MTSKFNGKDFGTRAFKFCAGVNNIVVIFICALEDRRVTSILKMFTYISSEYVDSLQLRKVRLSILRNIPTFQVTKVFRLVSFSTGF
jgi:hypothetical protein